MYQHGFCITCMIQCSKYAIQVVITCAELAQFWCIHNLSSELAKLTLPRVAVSWNECENCQISVEDVCVCNIMLQTVLE